MQLAKLTVVARDGNPGPLEWIERLQPASSFRSWHADRYRDPVTLANVSIADDGSVSVAYMEPVPGHTSAFQHHPYSSLYWAAFGQAG